VQLALKVAVAAGTVRRMLVGDPAIQQLELLAGALMEPLNSGEHLARPGEVLAHEEVVSSLRSALHVGEWRAETGSQERFAPITIATPAEPAPWPAIAPGQLADELLRPWLLDVVYQRVRSGQSAFLSELRPVAALFLAFAGIDHEGDPAAQQQLDHFTRWVQAVLKRYDGALLQLTLGEKGNFLYAAFGAPVAHANNGVRAVRAALELRTPPPELSFIRRVRMGVSYGQMRAGAYGGSTRRTYGVLGDKTNLAARLMQAADDILCDEAIYELARTRITFASLPPISVKGKREPVAVYRPLDAAEPDDLAGQIDRLEPALQLTLKVASVLGNGFAQPLLQATHPALSEPAQLVAELASLASAGLIAPGNLAAEGQLWAFVDDAVRELIYSRMLYAQRRQLHRAAALWYEHMGNAALYGRQLALHWMQAEEPRRALRALEQAAAIARSIGDDAVALQYLNASLELSALVGGLSDEGEE
jgi:class 3 adenylate cyclase